MFNFNMNNNEDIVFMKEALKEAYTAYEIGEVPVGAVIVKDGEVIGKGHNLRESLGDPTAHAEILAIREAAKVVGNWRLEGTTLYITLEPCIMCTGAIVLARIKRVVFGAADPKMGAVISKLRIFDIEGLNHRVIYEFGILEEESEKILKDFFKILRNKEKWPSLAEGARLEIE